MKRRLLSLFLVLSLALSLVLIPASADDGAPQPQQASTVQAVYLGIENFAGSDGANKDSFTYRFSVNGTEKIYSIAKDESYSIQNQLQEGYVYDR